MPLPLPRELRDTVYNYLWDEETAKKTNLSLDPSLDNFPDRHETAGKRLPWFFKPRYLGQETTEEIVESFYRFCPTLEVKSARYIKPMLEKDFFGVNMRLREHTISAFTVSVQADTWNPEYINTVQLGNYLSTLLHDLPVLTSSFTLTLCLRATYRFYYLECKCASDQHCPVRHSNIEFADRVWHALKAVNDFVYDFELERDRKVVLCLEVENDYKTSKATMGLTLEDIDKDQEAWLKRLRQLYVSQ